MLIYPRCGGIMIKHKEVILIHMMNRGLYMEGLEMTHIIDNIENLREQMNKMITDKADNMKLYEISTELDAWIVQYYKEKQQ